MTRGPAPDHVDVDHQRHPFERKGRSLHVRARTREVLFLAAERREYQAYAGRPFAGREQSEPPRAAARRRSRCRRRRGNPARGGRRRAHRSARPARPTGRSPTAAAGGRPRCGHGGRRRRTDGSSRRIRPIDPERRESFGDRARRRVARPVVPASRPRSSGPASISTQERKLCSEGSRTVSSAGCSIPVRCSAGAQAGSGRRASPSSTAERASDRSRFRW